MLLSMTGYGRSTVVSDNISYQVEVKSLNSKTTDVRCKLPDGFIQEEIFVRQIINDRVIRGRIDVIISDAGQSGEEGPDINEALLEGYYKKYKKLCDRLGADSSQLIPAIMRLTDYNSSHQIEVSEEQWEVVKNALNQAIDGLIEFRKSEGKVLSQDLLERTIAIQQLLPQIEKFEGARIEKLRAKLRKNLDDFIQNDKIDHNRFEQEVLFYIEKLDISEEKVRLDQHCKYFIEQLKNESVQSGKVLAFIAQEMGREINTIGSKAQDSEMQQIVVSMKDELEKIKEQLANVL